MFSSDCLKLFWISDLNRVLICIFNIQRTICPQRSKDNEFRSGTKQPTSVCKMQIYFDLFFEDTFINLIISCPFNSCYYFFDVSHSQ